MGDDTEPATFRIGPAVVGQGSPVYIIAEVGVNHDGQVGLARELIHAAADAGADAVKFQVFSADRLVTREAPAATYQQQAGQGSSQHQMLSRLGLKHDDFAELARAAGRCGIEFLGTPFSIEDLRFLVSMSVRAIKLASPDIVNVPLLDAAAQSGLPVIASTGASCLEEVAAAVERFRAAGAVPLVPLSVSQLSGQPSVVQARDQLLVVQPRDQLLVVQASRLQVQPGRPHHNESLKPTSALALLHCVSSYPTPESQVNLAAIDTLAKAFGCVTGFSDHTESLTMGGYAVAAGARIIEKHFTLDRRRAGPDHAFSLEPAEMKEYVRGIRHAEQLLGDGTIAPQACEREIRDLARGSVVATCHIHAGQTLTEAMLTIKRPAGGIEPAQLQALLGRKARTDIPADTRITWEAVSSPDSPKD